MKKVLSTLANIFGIHRNSKYVKKYLNAANMRSGIFMSGIIVALETWLVIRQLQKYIIPKLMDPSNTSSWFRVVFTYTSNFWLLMSFGVAMFFYCIMFRQEKKSWKGALPTLISSGVSIALVALMPLEFYFSKSPITGITLGLLIALYASILAFDISLIVASIYQVKGGKSEILTSMLIISLFALVCLVFGVKVSYSDFASTRVIEGEVVPNPDYKEIICFLMMAIYVGCLLIWKPYVSIGILGSIFVGFYLLLKTVENGGGRAFPDGDQVNYITFFISLTMICVSIYDQRVSEAKKDEELELLATKDVLTGLWSFEYFTTLVSRKVKDNDVKVDEWIYLFLDITEFKTFNDQRGFDEGNKFLLEVGKVLTRTFDSDLITRQSDDHFVVFEKNENVLEKLDAINKEVAKLDLDIRPGVKAGGYILRDKLEDPHLSVEKARYALAELKRGLKGTYLVYDTEMHDNYRMVQYIVRHIDEAIEKGYIKAYYQPVVWSSGRALCGVEALARWADPKYGFLNPGLFVPALEDSQLVYKLDTAILRIVCKQMRENLDNKLPVIPVSINFSRVDFNVMDIVSVINEVVTEFNIPKDLLHIEVTESALSESEDVLKSSIKRLHQLGYAVWLDDFGSGYSSFNVLKDYEFDVLKLDMKLLSGFKDNPKSKFLIQSVVQMANQIGMQTLSEGVETMDEAKFLESIKCGRLQGYLYGKPLSYEQLMEKINKGELTISKELQVKK